MTATTSGTADGVPADGVPADGIPADGPKANGLPARPTVADALRGGDVPDLTVVRVAYRAMRAETARLVETAGRIAAGEQTCRTRRAAAIAAYVEVTCTGVQRQHQVEQSALWPLLRASGAAAGADTRPDTRSGAGARVDVDALVAEQRELEPLLEATVEAAGSLLPKDTETARRLAEALGPLRDALAHHLDAKEPAVVSAVLARVSASDWAALAAAARKTGNVRDDLPRLAAYANPDELDSVVAAAGRIAGVALTFLLPALRRRQRLVFGSDAR